METLSPPLDITSLRDLFQMFGTLQYVGIFRYQKSTFTFLSFATILEAIKIIKVFQDKLIGSQRLKFLPFYQNLNYFHRMIEIFNLAESFTWRHLQELFNQYGSVDHSCVMVDITGKTKQHGEVIMKTKDAAMMAITHLNGTVQCGHIIEVKLAQPIRMEMNGDNCMKDIPFQH
jgi:RNA recognition motif-containing protein